MTDTVPPTPHPQVAPLAPFLGTWRGRGQGHYPTIDSFEYDEEVRFWHTGRPWIGYEQRTWIAGTGAPSHSESGFWRPQPDGVIEIVLAHAFGVTELLEGIVTSRAGGASVVEARSTELTSTTSAKRIDGTERKLRVEGDVLTYEIGMAFGGRPLQNHLTATLKRT